VNRYVSSIGDSLRRLACFLDFLFINALEATQRIAPQRHDGTAHACPIVGVDRRSFWENDTNARRARGMLIPVERRRADRLY
jgi:hypothetical protein